MKNGISKTTSSILQHMELMVSAASYLVHMQTMPCHELQVEGVVVFIEAYTIFFSPAQH